MKLENIPEFKAKYDEDLVTIYQAYNLDIADYAVKNQQFGEGFSFKRMNWIKTSFLWIMYRSGWAMKDNQERVLEIEIDRSFFESIIKQSVLSSYNPEIYETKDRWGEEISSSEVIVQFDPDRDHFGRKKSEKAIQIGLRKNALKTYLSDKIESIGDISDYVHEQYQSLRLKRLDELMMPVERPYVFKCKSD